MLFAICAQGWPDTLIGQETFNFFQLGLTHKSWGPRWINLYSNKPTANSQVTTLARLLDWNTDEDAPSEYVGRLLLRMSAEARDDGGATLLSVPCPPALDPVGEDFVLTFLLYSCSELPVMGGRICVEIVFGTKYSRSEWQYGKNGVFQWHKKLQPLQCYCPKDLSQIHNIFINVFHKVGGAIRKISFEKINVTELYPVPSHATSAAQPAYYINGETKANIGNNSKLPPWPTRWRTLQPGQKDKANAHVPGGFLNCAIGFGPKSACPDFEAVPNPISNNHGTYTLRSYIHQVSCCSCFIKLYVLLSSADDG